MTRSPKKRGRRTFGGILRPSLLLCAIALVALPSPAEAFELSGGVSLGGILAGTEPRLAVSPHAGISWRMESGFLVAAHDLFSILPATNRDGSASTTRPRSPSDMRRRMAISASAPRSRSTRCRRAASRCAGAWSGSHRGDMRRRTYTSPDGWGSR